MGLILVHLLILSLAQSSHVSVKLEANWEGRDLLLELGEFFSQPKIRPNFWSLLEYSFTPHSMETLSNATDSDIYYWAKSATSHVLGPLQSVSMEVTLSMGTFSPSLLATRQTQPPSECLPFVLLNDQTFCDPAQIPPNRPYNEAFSQFNISGEHLWGDYTEGVPTAVLYGFFGDEKTKLLHDALRDMPFNYVFRLSLKPSPGRISLSGYSLVLSIKNTEYKAVDDSPIEDDGTSANESKTVFDYRQLGALGEGCPESLEECVRLTMTLPPAKSLPSNLGLKVLSYVVEAEDKMSALSLVSSMVPSLPNLLGNISVSPRVRRLHRTIEGEFNKLPENAVYINSRKFHLEDSNLFKLGQLLLSECKLVDTLHSLGFSPSEIASVSSLPNSDLADRFAVDYRKWSTLYYWNDLEMNYNSQWHSSLRRMLQSAMLFGIQPVSLNFLTFVFVIKPSDPLVSLLLDICKQTIADDVSIRFAFLFVTDDTSSAIDARIWHTFRTMARKNARSAWKFLREFDLDKLEDPDEESKSLLQLSTEYSQSSGMSGLPGIIVNGVAQHKVDLSLGRLRKLIMSTYHDFFNELAMDYFNGDYEEGDDAPAYALSKSTVLQKINPVFLQRRDSQLFVDFGRIPHLREMLKTVPYVTTSRTPHTVWVVADFARPGMVNLARDLVERSRGKQFRLSLIPRSPAGFCGTFKLGEECDVFVEHLPDLLGVLPPNETLLVVDGRVFRLGEGHFELEDFDVIERAVLPSGLGLSRLEDSYGADDVLLVKGVIDGLGRSPVDLSLFDDVRAFHEDPDTSQPFLSLQMFVNPLEPGSHQIVRIVRELRRVFNSRLDVYIDPQSENAGDKYYGYAFQSSLTFTAEGDIAEGPVVEVVDLPEKTLLSASISAIHNWMVSPRATPHDLDNIVLSRDLGGVSALYRLDYIIVEGHCFDSANQEFPGGLQLYLGDHSSQQFDTIVMRNIGYFQLKANPGVWWLSSGRKPSGESYSISSVDGTDGVFPDHRIIVDSFHTQIVTVEVALDPSSLWDSITGFFSGSSAASPVVNVFSLASGHLYERLLKVMMLSVLNHTTSPVKFYFLKNFLSPSFKDFLPHFARQYGFEFVLVEYVWPHWLRKQTVRQRIIWGYKILFLDVLFPQNVSRIIYLDADQTIRTNIRDLFEVDLKGSPYGFTPFCDNRSEMDSYRFWKSTYWMSVLNGRPYHISALFVVDLDMFRKISAGDILREQYHALTVDPTNLANLDQDLPNSLMRYIPMHSLDVSWLWCETWCSAESKTKAKTIDLCNNPRTKESKLHSALRIVPEWKLYDQEIQDFAQRSKASSNPVLIDEL